MEELKEEVRVYLDGSGIGRQVGVAVVLFRNREEIRELRKQIGPEDQHTIFEGEVVGMLLAAELIRAEGYVDMEVIGINSHSQVAIWVTGSTRGSSGQHLLTKLHDHMALAQCRCGEVAIVLRWIPGHEGLHENERVDEEAKKAARGDSSPACLLPQTCRGYILISR